MHALKMKCIPFSGSQGQRLRNCVRRKTSNICALRCDPVVILESCASNFQGKIFLHLLGCSSLVNDTKTARNTREEQQCFSESQEEESINKLLEMRMKPRRAMIAMHAQNDGKREVPSQYRKSKNNCSISTHY